MRTLSFCFWMGLVLLLPLWGCPTTPNQETTPEQITTDADSGPQAQCVAPRDCSGDCVNGQCVPTNSCTKLADCKDTQMCYKGRCVTRCALDTECPKEYVCADGQCHKPQWKTGAPPNPAGSATKPLQAGLGVVALDIPLGISMAGYGGRLGAVGPYADTLAASNAQYDRFFVKALALDNGQRRLFLVRSPMCWVSDYLQTQIIQYVIEKTGTDVSDGLIITATHTHSGPARFWYLLPELKLGVLGYGNFLPEAFRRTVVSFGEAIIAANKALQPARLGYAIDPNFDPEDRIFRDRRGASPKEKQPVLLVMRVDKQDGSPLATLVSFPMHGTAVSSKKFALTQDSAGGVELQIEEYFEKKLNKRVEAFFMQGPGGDVSPAGDHLQHEEVRKLQMIGRLAAEHTWKIYESIQTKEDITLDVVHKRIGISRELIGYTNDEFYEDKDGKKVPYRFGALQCVVAEYDYEKQPDKQHQDGHLGCGLVAELINNGAPIPQFSKTHLTAAKIGNLALATFPGEVTSFLAIRLRKALQEQSNGKLQDVITLGYSQDHHFYILEEKDWWRGGYEASMNVWGPRFGEYLLKHITELALQLASETKPDNKTDFLPQDFLDIDLTPMVPRETTPNAGKIVTQPPKTYRRLDPPLTFTLSGGFSGIDNPHVVLQKQEGTKFQDVTLPGGRLYDDSGHRLIMRFEKKDDRWLYHFDFEELQGFPAGTYRFRIAGKQWDGSKITEYTTETDSFEIQATDKIRIQDVKIENKTLTAIIGYPAGTNDDGTNSFTSLQRLGHRLRSHLVFWDTPSPLAEQYDQASGKIEITQQGNPVLSLSFGKLPEPQELEVSVVTSRDDQGATNKRTHKVPATQLSQDLGQLSPGTYDVTIEVTDAFGNTGKTSTLSLEIK
ncbi:MAG: neutral/alkaline non-lysosomal ceramidase N-terminal domain-containing protein [Myxococcales bacterium]|nr:neutral/alkaline non-lysosomal ceramidase N-terminal domain-containing protein [Myxococcales bacterium]